MKDIHTSPQTNRQQPTTVNRMADTKNSKGLAKLAALALAVALVAFAGTQWQDAQEDDQIDGIADDFSDQLGTSEP